MGDEYYKSRQFCRDKGCDVQIEMDKYEKDGSMYEGLKGECRGNCRFSRTDFVMYLDEQGFVLRGLGEVDATFAGGTAYQFHDWLQKYGVEIVKAELAEEEVA
ncbi:hypothetical protein KY359_06745 [Candidatus Woesearchaeota archaeon]|nr:hypothetical protein [Candidatus Woesearchaeota archaeon]